MCNYVSVYLGVSTHVHTYVPAITFLFYAVESKPGGIFECQLCLLMHLGYRVNYRAREINPGTTSASSGSHTRGK